MKLLLLILLLFSAMSFAQMTQNPYIPLTQPFNRAPWNYNGTENVTAIPDSVVDWVLIELRGLYVPELNCQEVVYRRAGFVKMDGTIVSTNNDTIRYGTTYGDERHVNMPVDNTSGDYHMVIYHRNHIPVMTKNPLRFMDGYLSVNNDFTISPEFIWADTLGVAKINDTTYAMIGGDADGNGVINVLDYAPIQNGLFQTGYLNADVDGNGVINVLDYGLVKKNLFRSNLLPKIYLRQQVIPTTITASSYVSPYTPTKTVDGYTSENPNESGRWLSQNGMPQWIQFHFFEETYIEDIVVNFWTGEGNSNGTPRCSVEVSDDGTIWNLIKYDWLQHKWNYLDIRDSIRYLKITIVSVNAPQTNISIYEVNFYTYKP